jgi:uncharacterized alpha-E superfamily protein
MTRSHGWRFLDLGRRLERSAALLLLVQGTLKEDPEGRHLLMPLLDIADSAMTYRRRYFAHAQTDAVLDLLLREKENPRSALFQVLSIEEHLAHLPAMLGRTDPGLKQRLTADLASRLRALNSDVPAPALAAEIGDITQAVYRLSDRIAHVYFSHAGASIS